MKRLRIQLIAALPLGETTVVFSVGKARVTRGKARSGLISELTLLAESEGIQSACIHVKAHKGGGDHLSFYGIPEPLHQRFRNVWNANSR